ncbi:hypothetical protein H0H87_009718 [Tephrocybe sp. NHM501043]|nr:hypothetical protein H0H87_009718 [Tephrocybe sp. NHM501043]
MFPSPSSSPQAILHERTNILRTSIQSKIPFGLPTPPTDKQRSVIASDSSLPQKRKLSFSRSDAVSTRTVQELENGDDVEMEDMALPVRRTARNTPFHMTMRAGTGLLGRRREEASTRPILQSFVSSNKSDIYKCEAASSSAYLTPPYACSYTSGAKNGGIPLLAVATEQGSVHVFNTTKRNDCDPQPPQEIIQVHQNGIFDVKWNHDDSRLATCSGDQSTKIVCSTTGQCQYTLRGHASTVKSIAWDPSNVNLLSTGGRDGGICLWDVRIPGVEQDGAHTLSPVISIPGAHEDSMSKARRRGKKVPAPRSVTSLIYPEMGTYGVVSSGSFDGVLKYWDLRLPILTKRSGKRKVPTNLYSSPNDPTTFHGSRRSRGIVKLSAGTGPTAGLVFGLGADSRIHVYDLMSLDPLSTGYSHENMQTNSFYVGLALSPCGRWLATGGGASGTDAEGSTFLFEVGNAGRPSHPGNSQAGIQLKCQQGEVGAVDWAAHTIVSCADDGTVRAWRPDIGTYRECMEDPEEKRWDWTWHS